MEFASVMVVQWTIGVSYPIIICIGWLFAIKHLICDMDTLTKIIKSQPSNIVIKLPYDYIPNQSKQMAYHFILYNGNLVNGKAWLIIVCNGFKKLSHVTLVDMHDLFGNANTQNKINKIISKYIVNDNLVVEVYGGDAGCSWGIYTLINKCRMYCSNLGIFLTICIISCGIGDDLSFVLIRLIWM